jgi:hypothetical protein
MSQNCSHQGDMWAWRAMVVMMMPAGDNSWLIHQSSLAVLPAETSGASRWNGRRRENFAYQCLKYLKGFLICRKILRHGTSSFTSHLKEGVLQILSPLKIHRLGRVWTRGHWVQRQAHSLISTTPRRLYLRRYCKCPIEVLKSDCAILQGIFQSICRQPRGKPRIIQNGIKIPSSL